MTVQHPATHSQTKIYLNNVIFSLNFLFAPSVPCPPAEVEPVLDCSTNAARVEWKASSGADFYIVQALGVEEHETGCETESQSCVLAELMCGYTYNISVTAINSVCNVSTSGITQLRAGKDDHSNFLTH